MPDFVCQTHLAQGKLGVFARKGSLGLPKGPQRLVHQKGSFHLPSHSGKHLPQVLQVMGVRPRTQAQAIHDGHA